MPRGGHTDDPGKRRRASRPASLADRSGSDGLAAESAARAGRLDKLNWLSVRFIKCPGRWFPARGSDWIDEAHAAEAEIHGDSGVPLPEILARLHDGFEKVHPFIDGNGRTSRLLLNLLLVRLGYPPIIVLKRQRPAYLAAMQRADDGDYAPLGEILARAMYDNLNRFIVPSLAGPARLVPLAALVDKELQGLKG